MTSNWLSSGPAAVQQGPPKYTTLPAKVPPPPPKPPAPPPPPPTPPGPPPQGGPPDLTDTQRNAYTLLKDLFHTYNLDTLAPEILTLIQKGYQQDTIPVMLQETDAYKQRFAGNAIRAKNGLKVLSPAEYLSVEDSYQQVLRSYGLPSGFYDQPSDFHQWIGNDVAPAEVDKRASIASEAVNTSDPFYLQSLQQMGLSQGDMVAHMLDSTRALPILQKQVAAAKVGAEALKQGLTFDNTRVQQFVDQGLTQQQAQQGYQVIGENLQNAQNLAGIYGQDYGQTQMENELLGGSGLASQQRKRLAAQETGTFTGTESAQKSFGQATRGEF